VHLDHVERGAVSDRDARVADLVGRRCRALRAVEALGEDARERGLASAARAGEEIGLAGLSGGDRVLERPDDRFLADDLVEVLRAVLAVEGGHSPSILLGRLDRAREGVALGRLARLVAAREPAAALLGGAVRPRLGVHLTLRSLLDPVAPKTA